MMNVLALCFLMTTLVTAGVFDRKHQPETLMKEGHRVVVVEFEKDDGTTKVSISPPEEKGHKFSDKSIEGEGKQEQIDLQHGSSVRELVCDAFGKCEQKIESAIGTTKEAADEVNEEAHETKERFQDAASEATSKAKEKVQEAKEVAKEKAERVKRGAEDTAKTVNEEGERIGSEKMEAVKEKAKQAKGMSETVSEEVKRAKEEGKRGLRKIWSNVFSPGLWMKKMMGVLHLLGFATAYGMCVWVTFGSSYVLANALARQQFATVQSKIYPVYFKAMAYSVGMALVGYLSSQGSPMKGLVTYRAFNLLAPLSMIMLNLLYFEPRATKVMFERMRKEKEDGRAKEGFNTIPSGAPAVDTAVRGTNGGRTSGDAAQERSKEAAIGRSQIILLSEKLKKLNSYSSLLNVVTLMFLTSHLVHLGQQLSTVC